MAPEATYRPQRALPPSLGSSHAKFRLEPKPQLADELALAIATELLEVVPRPSEGSAPPSIGAVCAALEDYAITDEMKRLQKNGRHEFFRKMRTRCPRFCALYEELIRTVIGPMLLREFEAEQPAGGALECAETRRVLYQFPPAVRVYCSHIGYRGEGPPLTTPELGPAVDAARRAAVVAEAQQQCKNLTMLHADSQYGHQDGEVNFWMPLTRIDETSTLWAESAPDKGDWYPFWPLERGECWRFPGTLCRHFTKPNVSGRTRVSIDFRCSVGSCYDKEWRRRGNPKEEERHEMREMQL